MKKIFITVSLIFSFSLFLISQTQPLATVRKDTSRFSNSLIWQITGNKMKDTSYIFGTIHLFPKKDFFLPGKTKESFAKAKTITFEIDMKNMTDLSTQVSLLLKAMMPNGITLKTLLSEDDYALVDKEFQKLGLPLMLFQNIKPLFLTSFLTGDISGTGGLSDDITSYEIEFLEMAKEQEKETAGLETIDFQMSMFDSIPYKVQAEMLVENIKAEENGDAGFDEFVEIYKNQDLEKLNEGLIADSEQFGDYLDLLLFDRNKKWIPEMVKQMNKNSTFFAVGAGHLAGKDGVLQLLTDEGFTLTPINK